MICANIQHPQRITPTVFGQMSHGIQAKRPFSTSPCRRTDKRKASPSRRSFSQQESHLGTLTSFKQSFPFTYYSFRLHSTCQWTRRQFNGSRATATETANVHLLLYEGSHMSARREHPLFLFNNRTVEKAQVPLVHPLHIRYSFLETDGQPDVTGIARMLRAPDVRHEDEAVIRSG